MPNFLTVRNVRSEPRVIPAAGGYVEIAFEARVSEKDADSVVTIAVQSGMPYSVTKGNQSKHRILRGGAAIRQPVRIARTNQNAAMNYIIVEIRIAIPGESQDHACFVYIGKPLGDQLKSLRNESGDSQQAAADAAGTSRDVVSRAERGLGLSAESEQRLAELLK